tara:strand:+ start:139 stop:339 length:201 start_codon:yes stop_codon:yes gene_type:complete
MDKTTKFLIRIACLIIILTITAPSIDKFLTCVFRNSYQCRDVPFMGWKYKRWRKNLPSKINPFKKR